MKVSEEKINQALALYNPAQRVLRSADFEYPIIKGIFYIGPTFYCSPPLEHAIDIEIQLCLDQLAYVGIAEAIHQGAIDLLKELNFQELQKENMLIIESRKRFRRPIRTNKNIVGENHKTFGFMYRFCENREKSYSAKLHFKNWRFLTCIKLKEWRDFGKLFLGYVDVEVFDKPRMSRMLFVRILEHSQDLENLEALVRGTLRAPQDLLNSNLDGRQNLTILRSKSPNKLHTLVWSETQGLFDFQFENKSCFGNLELALLKPNMARSADKK